MKIDGSGSTRLIILTVGIPASGKSTWAMSEIEKNPTKFKRVNKDLLREMLDCSIFSTKNEKFILDIRDRIVEKAILSGCNVIIDDTNFSKIHFDRMCEIAKRIGDVRVFEKFFDISLEDAIERNNSRPKKVPQNVIENMYDQYIKNSKTRKLEDVYFSHLYKKFKFMDNIKTNAIIVDLDGTLAINVTERNHYSNPEKCLEDFVNPVVENIILSRPDKIKLIFVSGRTESFRIYTEDWLNLNGFTDYVLFMRKDNDSRKDSIVKKEIYYNSIFPEYHICYVIDDRPQVCRMWRTLGLQVLQLNDLDF